MTKKQTADNEMMNLWINYVYKESVSGSKCNYKHLDEIIRSEAFIKKYVQCEQKICVYWIFILCDGEFGYFDGYTLHDNIPLAIAKLLDLEKDLKTKEFAIKDGCYVLASY